MSRNPAVEHVMQFFKYEHLPVGPLRTTSQRCSQFAETMLGLPDSPELTAGLRKLLEAKDCFVRAALQENR